MNCEHSKPKKQTDMKKTIPGFIVLAVLFVASAWHTVAERAEEEAVREAVLDYVEGIYEVEPARIERSVHKNLTKFGFYKSGEAEAYEGSPMTYDQLYTLAGRWNRNGQVDPKTATKEVVVLDVLDQTASAKLVADWGIDYMHLAKYDGKWMITQVLWQSHPPKM
jgi:hypothetical protein